MGELTTYQPSDFILFSQSAYFRQFELYNKAVWPLHIIAILFSVVITYALWRKFVWTGRLIASLLVVSWLWVALAFLYHRFFQIHIVADWYALAFILQAAFLAWYGIFKNRLNFFVDNQNRIKIVSLLLFVAILFYPFIAFLSGRSWMQFEMFSLAPDPTALATIAILLFFQAPVVLYIIPLMWLIVSAVTLFIM